MEMRAGTGTGTGEAVSMDTGGLNGNPSGRVPGGLFGYGAARNWLRIVHALRRHQEASEPGDRNAPPVLHIGEETTTYATIDPVWYTPTPDKPFRGIWVGDYNGHGCEFLLINQPEDEDDTLERHSTARQEHETEADFEARKRVERAYRGRLEAIKLTGDPNVPRGEYTFIADDIGEKGSVTTAQDSPFNGAKIVKSRGHIAGAGFVNGKNNSYVATTRKLKSLMLQINILSPNSSLSPMTALRTTGLASDTLGFSIG
jgi:hypothetical protein